MCQKGLLSVWSGSLGEEVSKMKVAVGDMIGVVAMDRLPSEGEVEVLFTLSRKRRMILVSQVEVLPATLFRSSDRYAPPPGMGLYYGPNTYEDSED